MVLVGVTVPVAPTRRVREVPTAFPLPALPALPVLKEF